MTIFDWVQYQAGVIAGRAAAANACAEQLEELRLMRKDAELRLLEAESQAAEAEALLDKQRDLADAERSRHEGIVVAIRVKVDEDMAAMRTKLEQGRPPRIGNICQGCQHEYLRIDPVTPHSYKDCAVKWRDRYEEEQQRKYRILDMLLQAQSSDAPKMALEGIIQTLKEGDS